ncbi:uncharacterized protein LOC142597933 [Dermatophagoides farinae]|uniref:uncharacterized protein LOC142597933 n=1 Tax=Dermatophagoides farinae TaxID=6954 RepID=UPI003F63AB7D
MSNEEIDYWKEPEFDESQISSCCFAQSDFKIVFPDYRSSYLKQIWPKVTDLLKAKRIDCELNLIERYMFVKTTDKTYDPYIIIRARDFIKLLSRSVPLEKAKLILNDDMYCEIVKLSSFVSNKEKLIKRRQRLIGPDGSTLKAIEILTKCYVCLCGQTAAIIGPWKGLRKCYKLIVDAMKNFHPVYRLKELMIERELAKNPEMKDKDWSLYLPKFKKSLKPVGKRNSQS